jgi:hypothetical protein
MRGGALNVDLIRTDNKEKFWGPCKTRKRIRKYFEVSRCKPDVRDGFGYLGPGERTRLRTLKERGTGHSNVSFISFKKVTLASLKENEFSLPGRNSSSMCVVGSF